MLGSRRRLGRGGDCAVGGGGERAAEGCIVVAFVY